MGWFFPLNLVFLYDHTSFSLFDLLDVTCIMFKGHKFFLKFISMNPCFIFCSHYLYACARGC